MSAGDARLRDVAVSAGATWTLLLPPSWVSLPTEPDTGRAAVKRVLDRRLSHLPRDQVAPARIELDRMLRGLLADAHDAGATAVHALVELVRGMPVSASLAVTVAPLPGAGLDTRALAGVLRDGGDVQESDARLLGDLPALRRRRRWHDVVPQTGTREVAVWHTGVDWVVPSPDGDEVLVLTFTTMTEPVVEELVVLFDAIAGSLDLRAPD